MSKVLLVIAACGVFLIGLGVVTGVGEFAIIGMVCELVAFGGVLANRWWKKRQKSVK